MALSFLSLYGKSSVGCSSDFIASIFHRNPFFFSFYILFAFCSHFLCLIHLKCFTPTEVEVGDVQRHITSNGLKRYSKFEKNYKRRRRKEKEKKAIAEQNKNIYQHCAFVVDFHIPLKCLRFLLHMKKFD